MRKEINLKSFFWFRQNYLLFFLHLVQIHSEVAATSMFFPRNTKFTLRQFKNRLLLTEDRFPVT